jgi:hypothetical protein
MKVFVGIFQGPFIVYELPNLLTLAMSSSTLQSRRDTAMHIQSFVTGYWKTQPQGLYGNEAPY